MFDNVQRAVYFNQRNRRVDKMPSIAKKRLLRKKYRKHFLSSSETTNSSQTSGSVFAERIEEIKETKYKLELEKLVECFLVRYGRYSSIIVTFAKKLHKLTTFCHPKGSKKVKW